MTPEKLIESYEARSVDLADAVVEEVELLDRRPVLRAQLLRELVGSLNDLTGKPHSVTSADAAIDADPRWLSLNSERRKATRERILAASRQEAALLRTRVALFRDDAGLPEER